jgi:putative transposase
MYEQIKRLPYPSDLSDEEWEIIEPYVTIPQTNRGRKRTHPYREILNAIFYLVRSGCSWRCCPTTFRIGRLSIPISVIGAMMEVGNV